MEETFKKFNSFQSDINEKNGWPKQFEDICDDIEHAINQGTIFRHELLGKITQKEIDNYSKKLDKLNMAFTEFKISL